MIIKELSIIFPIYNEENRLKRNLYKIIKLFKSFKSIKLEIILVNDGSTDNTHKIIKKYLDSFKKKYIKNKINYIYYKNNRGKGYALKKGLIHASKEWKLTCDIDFSADPSELIKWMRFNYIKNKKCCYFGSRELKKSKIKYRYYRKFLGNVFNNIVQMVFDLGIKDTQCGFKLYHKSYTKKIFSKLNEHGYIHDVEIAILLKKNSIRVIELPIKWVHKDQSQLNVFYDPLIMLIQLLLLRLRY